MANAKYNVNRLYKQCVMRGRENPYDAAIAIDQAIGGLTRVDFDPNKAFRLYNHQSNIGISLNGLNKKQRGRLDELVVLLHHVAEQSQEGFDQSQVSCVRLESKCGTALSTKHHRPAYLMFQQQVLEKYAA